ncbi:MAG TPA: hypothetical protein VH112_13045 [Acidimicrobiales bacterium]|nr:hypothetical protein [Acidimicrobiales bacterium]
MGVDTHACPPPRIAVVGWGSLIWDPRELPLRSTWQPDGPALPVEFTRVASDGRLALGLRGGVGDVQTLWAIMSGGELEVARSQLAERERTVPDRIGCLDRRGAGCLDSLASISRVGPEVGDGDLVRRLGSWLADRRLDAVIWTALPPNFEERAGLALSVSAAVSYLEQVPDEVRRRAEQYVRRAPPQVRTDIRRGLERVLGWTPMM